MLVDRYQGLNRPVDDIIHRVGLPPANTRAAQVDKNKNNRTKKKVQNPDLFKTLWFL